MCYAGLPTYIVVTMGNDRKYAAQMVPFDQMAMGRPGPLESINFTVVRNGSFQQYSSLLGSRILDYVANNSSTYCVQNMIEI